MLNIRGTLKSTKSDFKMIFYFDSRVEKLIPIRRQFLRDLGIYENEILPSSRKRFDLTDSSARYISCTN